MQLSRLRIAVQKSGRLNSDSLDLLSRCGLKIRMHAGALLCHVENLPIDVLFVRDDDIPVLVIDGVCDLGIVGENVLLEKTLEAAECGTAYQFDVLKSLGFSQCRLAIAIPQEKSFATAETSLQKLKIATSHPLLLRQYLNQNQINADIMRISGSVEIAPRLGMSDAICDLVATGRTLEEHNLKEVITVLKSQAVLIKATTELSADKVLMFELLMRRIDSVMQAQESKYIMFHAPKSALATIKNILPGFESPTIIPLAGVKGKVAVHAVSSEGVFWNTLEKLKQAGASSILVLTIEKMMS